MQHSELVYICPEGGQAAIKKQVKALTKHVGPKRCRFMTPPEVYDSIQGFDVLFVDVSEDRDAFFAAFLERLQTLTFGEHETDRLVAARLAVRNWLSIESTLNGAIAKRMLMEGMIQDYLGIIGLELDSGWVELINRAVRVESGKISGDVLMVDGEYIHTLG